MHEIKTDLVKKKGTTMRQAKLCLFLALFFIVGIGFSPLVKADTGPKPTSLIEIIGVEGNYYIDLLVQYDRNVFELADSTIEQQINPDYYKDSFPDILNGYQDEDGFASYTLYTYIPHNIAQQEDPNKYMVGYFSAPSVFKIAVVTESNNLIISDVIHKQYFNAIFKYDLSDSSIVEMEQENSNQVYSPVGAVLEDFPYWSVTLMVFVGIIFTLVIEGGLLYLFKYREKHTYYLVIFMNIMTQMILNALIILGYYLFSELFGAYGILIIGEIVVFVVEAVVYNKCFLEKQKIGPVLYALIANLLSFGIGFLFVNLLM